MPEYFGPGQVKIGSYGFNASTQGIIDCPPLLGAYREFLANARNSHSIDFLLAVRAKKDPKLIVQTFIDIDASRAVNLPYSIQNLYRPLFARPDTEQPEEDGVALYDPEEVDDFDTLLKEGGDFETKPLGSSDYFDEAVIEVSKHLDLNFCSLFFRSVHFEKFCFSVIGTPNALARKLGITDASAIHRLGQLMIALEVRNGSLMQEINAEIAKTLRIDAKTLLLQVADKIKKQNREQTVERGDWRKQVWQNGTFKIAVKQFVEAKAKGDKAGMTATVDTAHSVASISLGLPEITKKMIAGEIINYAKTQASTTENAQGVHQCERPDLDISLVSTVDWKKFLKIYDLDLEDADDVRNIAEVFVKHGEKRAMSSSQKLFHKQKKKKGINFKFKNLRHVTAAVGDALTLKKIGKTPKKPLKASQVADKDEVAK